MVDAWPLPGDGLVLRDEIHYRHGRQLPTCRRGGVSANGWETHTYTRAQWKWGRVAFLSYRDVAGSPLVSGRLGICVLSVHDGADRWF